MLLSNFTKHQFSLYTLYYQISIELSYIQTTLKVKLMLRRPINQLVAQGIMPPLKTPPAFHEQRKQLERAKTGDMLKAKIQQRPARVELERRHILECSSAPIDPSLAERQRMLKKARLADQLNDQLSHRPGPLELIKKNILHTEEPIEQAVKTGKIPFKATCEGQVSKPQHPHSYVTLEDDSQGSSEGGGSGGSDVIESAAKSAGIVVSLAVPITTAQQTQHVVSLAPASLTFAELCQSVSANLLPITTVVAPPTAPSPAPSSSLSPLSSLASPATPQTPLTPRAQSSPAPGKDKNRKKSKLKSQPKTRTIKFHEYKGPPNAPQKNSSAIANNPNANGETSYQLLLEQQQLFLQWQLEWQHKYPQIILPAAQKTNNLDDTPAGSPPSSVTTSISQSEAPPLPRPLSRLEDMKVSDLKAELKRRNLPVSGPKPQLIERLKPFTEPLTHSGHIIMDTPPPPTPSEESQTEDDNKSQASPASSDHGSMDVVPESPVSTPITNDDLVREQQRKIEELQRELTKSQLQLQQVRNGVNVVTNGQKLALQHHVQARQALRQQQHVAFQNAAKNANLSGLVLNGQQAALVQLQLTKGKLVNGQTGTIQNFLGAIPIVPAAVITTTPATAVPQQPEVVQITRQHHNSLSSPPHSQNIEHTNIPEPPPLPPPPQLPPQYDDSPQPSTTELEKPSSVKSQIVDDVLEILIKNGELPPSAANDPITPNGCEMQTDSPLVHHQEISQALSDQMSKELSDAMSHHEKMAAQRKEQEEQQQHLNHIDHHHHQSPQSPMSTLDALFLGQTPNDLKDLALELETLDTVDFSALDMELDRQVAQHHEAMDESQSQQPQLHDHHAHQVFKQEMQDDHHQQNVMDLQNQMKQETVAPTEELMDVCTDINMDMDEPDWLDSLMPTETNTQPQNIPTTTIATSMIPTSVSYSDYSHSINAYDPLLGNSLLQDPFDLFGLEEFRGTVSDLSAPPSTMSWDKLDFAA
ncbi:myocardin-related transcription factor A isoform X1 [Chrysoperla carnea]|uniref:myocardin-related transcription factor A isoform X1 n=1 Tax=Chrysoperla carnea TaxID=189513 RepID=UPI001D06A1FD|nr:myocardin-related transcription factor A isoform X1 [Chrysoperla carnea]